MLSWATLTIVRFTQHFYNVWFDKYGMMSLLYYVMSISELTRYDVIVVLCHEYIRVDTVWCHYVMSTSELTRYDVMS